MYDFSLSTIHTKIVDSWLSNKDKPLFIRGCNRVGKSCLSKYLLRKHYIVEINSDFLKNKDIEDHIKESLFKKNILMMCSDNQYKALLLDDIQLFAAYDKISLKKIYNLLKKLDYSKYPTIIVSNFVSQKYINMLSSISYNISVNYINKHINITNHYGDKDINYTMNDKIDILFTKKYTIEHVFRFFASEYNIIALNLLENVPSVIKKDYLSTIYSIYETICMGDYIECKYLDKNIDIDILLFFLCVKPYFHIKCNAVSENYEYKYNSYIGRSIIQIHNQSISNTNIDYISLLHTLYKYDVLLNIDISGITSILSQSNFDIKVLEKQIKLFNYYYGKIMTKKQLKKILKSII